MKNNLSDGIQSFQLLLKNVRKTIDNVKLYDLQFNTEYF